MTAADETVRRRNGDFSWAKKTADEYRARGYEVAFEQVVDFLPGFRADLVARKGDDKRVVEVKRRSSLQHDSIIDEVARTIESQPGWSLDIVMVPEPLHLVTPPESHPLAPQQASCGLDVSERLAELGQTAAAFLMAWSACEALLRGRVEEAIEMSDEGSLTHLLLDSATMYGVVSHDDRDYLKSLLPLRNAVAHGFSHDEIDRGTVAAFVRYVRELAADAAEDGTEASDFKVS